METSSSTTRTACSFVTSATRESPSARNAPSTLRPHHDPAAGPQGDHRVRADGLLLCEREAPPARKSGQHQDSLHPGEPFADADARTAAEREIGPFWPGRLAGEPLRIESFRVGPKARIAVHDPLREEDDRTAWNRETAYFHILESQPSDHPGRRIETHRLRDHHPRVRQTLERDAWRRIDLPMELPLDLRVLRQKVPRPRQRVRRGLVSREKKRHGFVAYLTVGHAAASPLLVLRQKEHRQQIAAIDAAGTPLGDH